MLAEICNFRAAHQSMTGKPDSALKLMRLAESYATEAGNNFLLPMIKNNLAFNLVRKGQIGEAQQLYREAAKMLESTPFKKAHSSLLTRLGTSYQSTGDLRRAFYYHEKSLTSSEDEGLNLFGFQNRLALGSILRSQGNIEEAVRQHLELQQIYSIYLDNWLDERTQLNVELAKDYLDAGDSEKARHYAEKAWSERDKPIRFHYSLDIYTAYAKVLTTLGDLTRAEQVLVSALTKFDGELQQPGRQLELLTELLNLMIEQNRLQEALVTAERAQRLIRTVRNQLNGGNIGPFWDEKTHEITDAYASLLLASEDDGIPIAFNILQANRAISLRQQLHKQSQTEIGEAQSDQKHDRLWHQLLEAQRALIAAEARKEDTTGKRAEVIQAEDRYLATRPNSESVNSADLEILNIAEIQSQLSPDELVLSLLTSDENSFIVQIDSESVFLHHLPNVDIERLSDDAVLQLMNSDALPEISALSDAILGSLNDPSRYSSVIIELYGSLSRLPFAALNMPSTGERLIDQMSITYTPSLSEFFTTREEYEEGVRSAVVLADPEYPTDDEALASSTIRWRNDLSSLDYTRAEALKVADHFDDSIVYLGEDATRSNLLSGDSRYAKILHLASHGFVSERQPGLSGFLLADHHQDGLSGFLTSFDLANHEFHSELVVISGCDTARGELLGNEGMLGLARAFLAQGAKTTIATLWPISDRASAIFMAYFYEALTEGGNSLPESLRLAQTRLKANPRFRHPVFWSPFVLYSLDRSAKPIDKL